MRPTLWACTTAQPSQAAGQCTTLTADQPPPASRCKGGSSWPARCSALTWTCCRLEAQHTVTASNLFKYCQPCHGLVLFKHHEPLDFSPAQLSDLLALSQGWLQIAHRLHPQARHPLVLWNALHRAGASQYHGHAQVLLSAVRVLLLSVVAGVLELRRPC